jgi:hypothetical protein
MSLCLSGLSRRLGSTRTPAQTPRVPFARRAPRAVTAAPDDVGETGLRRGRDQRKGHGSPTTTDRLQGRGATEPGHRVRWPGDRRTPARMEATRAARGQGGRGTGASRLDGGKPGPARRDEERTPQSGAARAADGDRGCQAEQGRRDCHHARRARVEGSTGRGGARRGQGGAGTASGSGPRATAAQVEWRPKSGAGGPTAEERHAPGQRGCRAEWGPDRPKAGQEDGRAEQAPDGREGGRAGGRGNRRANRREGEGSTGHPITRERSGRGAERGLWEAVHGESTTRAEQGREGAGGGRSGAWVERGRGGSARWAERGREEARATPPWPGGGGGGTEGGPGNHRTDGGGAPPGTASGAGCGQARADGREAGRTRAEGERAGWTRRPTGRPPDRARVYHSRGRTLPGSPPTRSVERRGTKPPTPVGVGHTDAGSDRRSGHGSDIVEDVGRIRKIT